MAVKKEAQAKTKGGAAVAAALGIGGAVGLAALLLTRKAGAKEGLSLLQITGLQNENTGEVIDEHGSLFALEGHVINVLYKFNNAGEMLPVTYRAGLWLGAHDELLYVERSDIIATGDVEDYMTISLAGVPVGQYGVSVAVMPVGTAEVLGPVYSSPLAVNVVTLTEMLALYEIIVDSEPIQDKKLPLILV